MQSVFESMSAKLTAAPRCSAPVHEAQYVTLGQMISSPAPTPQAQNAVSSALVPFGKLSAFRQPSHWANSASNCWAMSLADMLRLRSTSSTASSSPRVMMGQSKRSPGSAVTVFGPPNRASDENVDGSTVLAEECMLLPLPWWWCVRDARRLSF